MIENSNYKFYASVSSEAYFNKEISGAMIGTTKDENNRKIRKQYGYQANKGIGYKECEVTPNELLNLLINGHVFCHLFNAKQVRKDGTFGSSQKKDDNFNGSYCIGVDIDETGYSSISDYINTLEYKPTFYYSSYSNKTYKPKFRMVYVFNELIEGKYFFRYCAWQLNSKIEIDTDEEITDDCNLRCSQYFNGTNINNSDLVVEFGITNNIYSFYDFDITEYGYIKFLEHDCYYKTKNKERRIDINNLLYSYYNTNNVSYSVSTINYSTTYYNDLQKCEQSSYEENDNINSTTTTVSIKRDYEYNPTLVNDMARLEYDEFMKYNRHNYQYFYRAEKTEWIDNVYQYIDEDYFSLYWNAKTVQDGNKRRKKVFERMCLRRVLKPNVDIDTIIFNAYEDIHRFFNNDDNVLNTDYIISNAVRCFSLSIDDIKEMYSDNIEFLKSKKPKSGIILKRNVGNLAERNSYLKSIRYNLIDDYFDCNCTVQENLEFIKSNLFQISEKTLYNYCKDRGIDTKRNKKNSDEEILSVYDSSLSIRKNIEVMKKLGIKVSIGKLQKLITEINTDSNASNLLNSNNSITNNDNISINNNNYSNNNINNNSNISFSSSFITTYYNELQKNEHFNYEEKVSENYIISSTDSVIEEFEEDFNDKVNISDNDNIYNMNWQPQFNLNPDNYIISEMTY